MAKNKEDKERLATLEVRVDEVCKDQKTITDSVASLHQRFDEFYQRIEKLIDKSIKQHGTSADKDTKYIMQSIEDTNKRIDEIEEFMGPIKAMYYFFKYPKLTIAIGVILYLGLLFKDIVIKVVMG